MNAAGVTLFVAWATVRHLRRAGFRLIFLVAGMLCVSTVSAAPAAGSANLELALDFEEDVTFSVYDLGLVSGGPAPVYIFESSITPNTSDDNRPADFEISRVGNFCIRLRWSDPDPEVLDPFDFDYTLIAGDRSRSTPGTITVEQGGTALPTNPNCSDAPGNDAPQANNIDAQATEATAKSITPIGTFATDQNGNETLRLTDRSLWTDPQNGTLQRVSDSEFVYTPNTGVIGQDTFTYCVTDDPLTIVPTNSNTVACGNVTVEVVTAGAPEVNDDQAQTELDTTVDIDVLANDPIGDAGILDSVSTPLQGGNAVIIAENACAGGTANMQGCIRYTPPPTDPNGRVFEGADTFIYVVSDASGRTSSASVTVNVVAPPGTPRAVDDAFSGVVAGEPIEFDVLANDSDDGGVAGLSIVDVTTPASGTASVTQGANQGDVITYTPSADFSGSDEFFYTVSDGDPATIDRVGRVTVSVVPPAVLTSLEPFAQNDTQRAVASTVDVVCPALNDLQASDPNPLPPGQEQLLTRCNALIEYAEDANDAAGVQSALQQIAGEEVFAQGTTGTSIVNTQIRNISARLSALRTGATGISAQGFAMNFGSGVLPVGALFGPRGGGASSDEAEGNGALLSDSRLGLFINGRINNGDQDATNNEDGFDFDTLGVTVGADYRFRNNLVIGGAVGYADSEVEFNLGGGDLKTEAMSYSIYGSYYSEKLYVDVLAGSGGSDIDTRRIMVFTDARGGVDTVALGATSGDQSMFSVSAGYNFVKGAWVFVPYFSYDYMNTEVDPYSETEGQGWELAFGKQEIKSRILTGGLRLAYNLSTGFGVFVPHLRAAFQKEFEDKVRTASVQFVNDPFDTVFEFLTEVPDTDFYRVGAGFSVVWPQGVSAFVDYESIQGYRNLSSGTLTAGLRVELRFR